MESPQSCSISRSFMTAPLQRQILAGAWSECRRQRREQIFEIRLLLHLSSYRVAAIAASLLDQSVLHGGSVATASTCRCLVGVPAAETRIRLESASDLLWITCSRNLAQLDRSFMAALLQRQKPPCRCFWSAGGREPRTVEQPQPSSTSWSNLARPVGPV